MVDRFLLKPAWDGGSRLFLSAHCCILSWTMDSSSLLIAERRETGRKLLMEDDGFPRLMMGMIVALRQLAGTRPSDQLRLKICSRHDLAGGGSFRRVVGWTPSGPGDLPPGWRRAASSSVEVSGPSRSRLFSGWGADR